MDGAAWEGVLRRVAYLLLTTFTVLGASVTAIGVVTSLHAFTVTSAVLTAALLRPLLGRPGRPPRVPPERAGRP